MTHSPSPLPLAAGSPIAANKQLEHALLPQTRILTCTGERPLGSLQVGERIITRDFGATELRGLITRTPGRGVEMVRIAAHAFGKNRPERPITVLADQPILLRDMRCQMLYGKPSVKIAARRLIDGTYVKGFRKDPGALIAMHFAKPAVVFANGLETVTAGLDPITARPHGKSRKT